MKEYIHGKDSYMFCNIDEAAKVLIERGEFYFTSDSKDIAEFNEEPTEWYAVSLENNYIILYCCGDSIGNIIDTLLFEGSKEDKIKAAFAEILKHEFGYDIKDIKEICIDFTEFKEEK
jgi:tRNA G46 methylase TrmB